MQVPPGTFDFLQGVDKQFALPQLQMDIRGRITMINNKVTIEVATLNQNLKQYIGAKHQLLQTAKVTQWAIIHTLECILITNRHLFVVVGS